MTDLLAIIGGVSSVLAAAAAGGAWLAPRLFEHWLDRRVKDYGARLEVANATAIERVRTELAIAAHETQARATALVEKQADVLAETYRLLMEAERSCVAMMAPARLEGSATSAELAPAAQMAINAFAIYFDRRRIFFPEADADRLDTLCLHFSHASTKFSLFGIEGSPEDGMGYIRYESQADAWKMVSDLIPSARRGLEAQFRQLLGVSKGTPDALLAQADQLVKSKLGKQ